MGLMKCDLHAHTLHSGMCTLPVAKRFCRERRLGTDLITITDHGHEAAVCDSSLGSPYVRLTRDVLVICKEMTQCTLLTLSASPQIVGVRAVLLVNYWLEVAFAEHWFGRAIKRRTFVADGSYVVERAAP